jgi:hypothetical protein
VSVFRAAAKVQSPDGRAWEIYAYKIKVRDPDLPDPLGEPPFSGRYGAGWSIVDGILYLVLLVPRGLVRLLDVAFAAARSARSDDWTIDAVTYAPRETVYRWTTTGEFKGQVVAQVQGHLQRGDIPAHLTNAVYRGEDRRSAR